MNFVVALCHLDAKYYTPLSSSLENRRFWTISFFRRFCQTCLFLRELDHPIIHFFKFPNRNFFLQNRVVSFSSNPQNGGLGISMSPSDRVDQLYPQAPGYLFVAFCDSQGYGGGILTLLHTAPTHSYTNGFGQWRRENWLNFEITKYINTVTVSRPLANAGLKQFEVLPLVYVKMNLNMDPDSGWSFLWFPQSSIKNAGILY
jgi:hypothetical protein